MAVDNATVKAAQAGNSKALNEIIKANLAYIKTLVGKIPELNQAYYDDLVQEGCLGLLKALEKYDINRKTTFLTYATSWIRKYISVGLSQCSYHIQLPAHMRAKCLKIITYTNKYYDEHKDYPTDEEVSEATEIPLEQIKTKYAFPQIYYFNATAVNNNDDKEMTFLDLLESDDNVQKWAMQEDLKREIHRALQTLDVRSREILILTYGLEGESVHTYEEIGKTYNLSRQRIEQILKVAKNKIKSNPYISTTLRSYC